MSKLTKFKQNGRRLLTLGLVPVLAITISACSNNELTSLDSNANYLKVGNYSVTNGEVWDSLKWSASDLFTDYKEQVVLQNEIDQIKTVLNNPNDANYDYYAKRLQNYIIEDVYDFSFSLDDHEEEIADLLEQTKEQNIKKYADDIYTTYRVNITSEEIINALETADYDLLSPLYEIYYNDFASELYARKKLYDEVTEENENVLKEDKEDDAVGYFSRADVANKYKDEYLNQDDVDVVMIRFASEDEMNQTLRAFGIKVDDDKFYYLTDTPESYNDYLTYYEDFDFDTASPNEYFNLDASYGHSIILQLYIAMYNYIYTYRNIDSNNYAIPNLKEGSELFNNTNIIDQRETTRSIIEYYNDTNIVYNADTDDERVDAIMDLVLSSTNGDYITYSAEEIKDLDSGLYDYIYETLITPSESEDGEYNRYSTTSDAYTVDNYKYMVFKYNQVNGIFEELYKNDMTDSELYDVILNYERRFDSDGNILPEGTEASDSNYSLFELINNDLIDDDLTDTYISDTLNAELSNVKVNIYDKSIEIAYSVDNSDYSKTLSGAPDNNTVAKFEYNDRTIYAYLTTEDKKGLWDILEYRNGIVTAANLISNKMIKDSDVYKQIPQNIIDNFHTTLEYILASFANDSLSSNGYPASIGKYNFLMLNYHTSDVDQIVEDTFMVSYAAQYILTDYSSDNVVDFFKEYSDAAYNNYFNMTAQKLSVYLDVNEDGEPDDIASWKDKTATINGETKTYTEIAKDLINTIYNLISLSNEAHTDALSAIVEDYNASSRYNSHEGGQFDQEDGYYDPLGNEWLFSIYKKLGFAISTEEVTVNNSSSDVDLAIKDGLRNIYLTEGFKMEESFPNAYLPNVSNSVVEALDSYNYFVITAASGPTSAKYEESSDELGLYENLYYIYNEHLVTIDNLYNSDDVLNANQIKAYLLEYTNSQTSNLLPSEISDSITNYLAPVLTRFQANGTQFEIILINICNDDFSKLEFADSANKERLNMIREINQRAADEYITYDEAHQMYNNFTNWWESLPTIVTGGNN